MKRIIKKYKTNRIMLIAAVMNTIIGVAFLVMYFALDSISNDIMDDSNPVIKFLLLPAWFLLELLSVAGLALGIPFTISGIVCFVLVFPYLGRLNEITKVRLGNGGKIPEDLLEDMLKYGELDQQEYERELAKYAPKEKSDDGEKSDISVKSVLLRIVGAALVLGIMIGLPVLIGYLLGILH